MSIASGRNPFWDTIKAVLICLVVIGHTGTALNRGLLSVIYAFHMPLFVFVSGYFSRKKNHKAFWVGIRRLLVIYFVFDILYLGLDFVLGETLSVKRLLTPSFALWYILSLVYWKSLVQFLPNWLFSSRLARGGIIVLSFVIAIVAGFVPVDTVMSFQRSCVFLPFFVLGYIARENGMVGWIRRRNGVIMGLLFVLLCVLCYFYMPVFYANTHYLSGYNDMIMRVVQLCMAIVLCLTVLGIVPDSLGGFTELGRWTLLIYLLHPPMIKGAKMLCLRVGIPMTPNTFIAIVISVLVISLIWLVRGWKVFKYIS